MEQAIERPQKFTFSGHDSFQCRQLWLKKGYDFVAAGKAFSDESAVVELGVGKNMVSSIRYWLRVFGIIGENDVPTDFGNRLFSDEGWDPYLEDEASLWLLHYQLLTLRLASTYYLVFNEFRRERIEFEKKDYLSFINRKSQVERNLNFNERTVGDDFEVFRKMYLTDEKAGNIEDSFAGLLSDLGLVGLFVKTKEHELGKSKNREKEEGFFIENSERPSLPTEIFLFAVLEQYVADKSIGLTNLSSDAKGPGTTFALSRSGIWDKIQQAVQKYDFVALQDYAGIQELQFKAAVQPLQILDNYYGHP